MTVLLEIARSNADSDESFPQGKPMRRNSLSVLASVFLAVLLSACNSTNNVREQELKKDEYLKKNFPVKKQGSNASLPVETTLDR